MVFKIPENIDPSWMASSLSKASDKELQQCLFSSPSRDLLPKLLNVLEGCFEKEEQALSFSSLACKIIRYLPSDTFSSLHSQIVRIMTAVIKSLPEVPSPSSPGSASLHKKIESLLHFWIEEKREDLVLHCLEQGVGFSHQTLCVACHHGRLPVVRKILEEAKDKGRTIRINDHDRNGFSPLHWASQSGNEQLVRTLLNHGASVDVQDVYQGQTPLHLASFLGLEGVVSVLLEHKADVTIENFEQHTPLHLASSQGHVGTIGLLLEKGKTNPCQTDSLGRFPIHLALLSGHQQSVQRLIRADSESVHFKSQHGCSPLHFASMRGRKEIIADLLQAGADLFDTDDSGKTALHYACHEGHVEAVQILIDNGGDLFLEDRYGISPLCEACIAGKCDIVELVMQRRIEINWAAIVERVFQLWESEEDFDLKPFFELILHLPGQEREKCVHRIRELDAEELSKTVNTLNLVEIVFALTFSKLRDKLVNHNSRCCLQDERLILGTLFLSKILSEKMLVGFFERLTPSQRIIAFPLVPESISIKLKALRQALIKAIKQEEPDIKNKLEELGRKIALLDQDAQTYSTLCQEFVSLRMRVNQAFSFLLSVAPLGSIQSVSLRNTRQTYHSHFETIEKLAEALEKKRLKIKFEEEDEDIVEVLSGIGIITPEDYRNEIGIEGPELYQMGVISHADCRCLGIGSEFYGFLGEILEMLNGNDAKTDLIIKKTEEFLTEKHKLLAHLQLLVGLPSLVGSKEPLEKARSAFAKAAKEVEAVLKNSLEQQENREKLAEGLRNLQKIDKMRRRTILKAYLQQQEGMTAWGKKYPKGSTEGPTPLASISPLSDTAPFELKTTLFRI